MAEDLAWLSKEERTHIVVSAGTPVGRVLLALRGRTLASARKGRGGAAESGERSGASVRGKGWGRRRGPPWRRASERGDGAARHAAVSRGEKRGRAAFKQRAEVQALAVKLRTTLEECDE